MGRAFHHDYRRRCIYHITLKKNPYIPSFGELAGTLPDVYIRRSRLGNIIANNIAAIPLLNPSLRVLQYCIMPDHIHLLLFATAPLEKNLGDYISQFKIKIGQQFQATATEDSSNLINSSLSSGQYQQIFEPDFYDCILYRNRPINTIYNYIRQNPYRLAVRRANPDFFRRTNLLNINSRPYQAYGNLQLLANPFKEQVVVHRADTAPERERNRQHWLYTASNGGVLVSPFISPAEKAIREEAEDCCGRFILIINEPMGERYKPGGSDFELCEAGRMLVISAGIPGELARSTCLAMNALAQQISKG